MTRPRLPDLEQALIAMLAARPRGASAAELRALLPGKPSQPTLSRRLLELRKLGHVVVQGRGPATRYHLASGTELQKLRSRLLHEAVALDLIRDPRRLRRVHTRLEQLRKSNPAARRLHDRWQDLMAGPRETLLRAMTEDSDAASDLRKESPMTVLLDPRQRERILARLHR